MNHLFTGNVKKTSENKPSCGNRTLKTHYFKTGVFKSERLRTRLFFLLTAIQKFHMFCACKGEEREQEDTNLARRHSSDRFRTIPRQQKLAGQLENSVAESCLRVSPGTSCTLSLLFKTITSDHMTEVTKLHTPPTNF